MKPINDNELSDIISKKIATVPDVETDHLWAGIESGLSSPSSGLRTGILKSIFFVSSFISVITISDSNSFANEPVDQERDILRNSNHNSESIIGMSKQNEKMGDTENPGQDVVLKSDYSSESKDMLEGPHLSPDKRIVVTNEVNLIKFGATALPEIEIGTMMNKIEDEGVKWANRGNYFVSISPYLTFHSMLPHAFDEYYIISSASSRVGLEKRFGANVSFGFAKTLSHRWVLSGSVGVDYFQTQFSYQIANSTSSEVALSNQRIDGGLNLGVGYQINSPLGKGTVLAESWIRRQIFDFRGSSSYNSMILGYRIGYLLEFKGMQVGPTYGSFFTSMNNEMGRVKPQQFGFTIRKSIGVKN